MPLYIDMSQLLITTNEMPCVLKS